jgi:hypothetical protein
MADKIFKVMMYGFIGLVIIRDLLILRQAKKARLTTAN